MLGGRLYGQNVPSEREWQVIQLVASGFKNSEVAVAIGTTHHVVKKLPSSYLRQTWTLESGRTCSLVRSTQAWATIPHPTVREMTRPQNLRLSGIGAMICFWHRRAIAIAKTTARAPVKRTMLAAARKKIAASQRAR